jgi:hypothetical protein
MWLLLWNLCFMLHCSVGISFEFCTDYLFIIILFSVFRVRFWAFFDFLLIIFIYLLFCWVLN